MKSAAAGPVWMIENKACLHATAWVGFPNSIIFFWNAVILGDMKQSDLLIGKKAERNDFPGRVNCPSTNNCKSTEQSSVEGCPGTKTRPSLLRNSSLLVGAMREQRRRGRSKEGKSVAGLESCFSFCPDLFTQKHPSGAVVIMEHKIA